jgi:hypothetical protein
VFVNSVGAVALYSKTVQNGRTNRGRKVAVGSTTNLSFAQIVVDARRDLSSVFVKRQHLLAALQWWPINAAFDYNAHARIKGLKTKNRPLSRCATFLRAKPQVNFRNGLSRNYIRHSTAAYYTYVD